MERQLSAARQGLQSFVGRVLPPVVSLPARSRFGGSREAELTLLPQLVSKGDTVIDVGAHRGVFTYQLARLVGPSGRVIAYEPQPALVSYLKAASRRGLMHSRVELRSTALSDRDGTATLSVPIEDGKRIIGRATLREVDTDAEEVGVRMTTLDSEPMPGRVSFVKIDVEGHELALLRGARGFLRKDRPTLLIEVEERHAGERISELAALLLDELEYSVSEYDGSRLTPVARERWAGPQLNERPDGRYVNNFVFRPR